PIPVVHFRFDDQDYSTHRAMAAAAGEIFDQIQNTTVPGFGVKPRGFASHERGTGRVGDDPRTPPLKKVFPEDDCKNLFVTDGSCFPSSSEKNPTLTIMALSLRAADHIRELRRKGEL